MPVSQQGPWTGVPPVQVFPDQFLHSQRLVLLVKADVKQHSGPQASSMPCAARSPTLLSHGPILLSLPFAPWLLTKALPVAFDIPHQISFHAGFGFPTSLLYTQMVPPLSSQVTLPCFHLLYIPFLSPRSTKSSLFIYAAPWHLYATCCLVRWSTCEHGGDGHSVSTPFLGPLIPPGPYPTGLFGADS